MYQRRKSFKMKWLKFHTFLFSNILVHMVCMSILAYLFPLLQLIHYWDIKDVIVSIYLLVLFMLNLFDYITSC